MLFFTGPGQEMLSPACQQRPDCLYFAAGHEQTVASVDVALDGRHLLTGSADGTARLWTLPDE